MRALKQLLLLAVIVAAALAFFSWPRINEVETGRTPEYPDLKELTFVASEQRVASAAKEVVEGLPRWSFVGSGKGPGGSEVKALAATPVFSLKHDVTIRVRRTGGVTRVSVRSRSRAFAWDFGQNARNIRKFVAALKERVV